MAPIASSRPGSSAPKIIMALAVIGVIGGIIYFTTKGGDTPGDEIVAKADGYKVTLDEANLRLRILNNNQAVAASFNDLKEESKQFVIREEIANRLLVKKARAEDLIEDEIVEKRTKMFEDNLYRKAKLEKIVTGVISEEALKEAYDKQVEIVKGQQEIKARHILVATQEDAKKVKADLENTSFEELAAKVSLDKKTAVNGGSLGVLYTGNMKDEFEKVILKLNTGEVSGPVQTEYGWHIFRLDSKKPAVILSYEQAKNKLASDIGQEAIQEYVEKLLKDVEIKLVNK